MAITTWDGVIGSAKQRVSYDKTSTTRTTVAGVWFTMFDLGGNPGAGTLAGASTAAGVVPTDATAGFPTINAFGGGATGYLAQVSYGNTVASRMRLFDMLFKAGAYAFNANQALAGQPSYSSRVPGGTDFSDTEIWIEAVTAFTGNPSFNITYTNQAGTGSRTTGTVASGAALTVGRMLQLPLQSGDTGVQKIDNVVATVATAGTFNVLVMRQLWHGRVRSVNDGDNHGPDRTQLVQVFADSAIFSNVAADGTSSGLPELEMTIING